MIRIGGHVGQGCVLSLIGGLMNPMKHNFTAVGRGRSLNIGQFLNGTIIIGFTGLCQLGNRVDLCQHIAIYRNLGGPGAKHLGCNGNRTGGEGYEHRVGSKGLSITYRHGRVIAMMQSITAGSRRINAERQIGVVINIVSNCSAKFIVGVQIHWDNTSVFYINGDTVHITIVFF